MKTLYQPYEGTGRGIIILYKFLLTQKKLRMYEERDILKLFIL